MPKTVSGGLDVNDENMWDPLPASHEVLEPQRPIIPEGAWREACKETLWREGGYPSGLGAVLQVFQNLTANAWHAANWEVVVVVVVDELDTPDVVSVASRRLNPKP
jgi:hypothetical protein